MRLQDFKYTVEYLPGPDNVVPDHLSRHHDDPVVSFAHLVLHSVAAVAGHLAYAVAGKALDVLEAGGVVLESENWCASALQAWWHEADADPEDIAREPCAACGEAKEHAHMVICETCQRPHHLQCCHPPRTVVPDGEGHCHECDEAYANVNEFKRADGNAALFAREHDPYHADVADVLADYTRRWNLGVREAHQSAAAQGRDSTQRERDHWGRELAEQAFPDSLLGPRRRSIRRTATELRIHPTQPDWYVQHTCLRSGEWRWIAVPPMEYRWGLNGAYHDRLGHAGISQTLTALRCHFAWAGIKADIAAEQCHPCQVQRLEAKVGPQLVRPRMSAPLEHVHVDLAGPFPVRQVAATTGK